MAVDPLDRRRRSARRSRTPRARPAPRPTPGRRPRRRSAGRCRRSPARPSRRCGAQSSAIARPVAVLPTCATTSTSPAASCAPTEPSPSRISSTPSGRCAASSSAKRRPVSGQRSLGLWTTVLPVTSAAPSRPAATATGSFQGVSTATTPRGPGTMKSVASQLPCRVRPRCTGPSSAYWTSVPIPASTPAAGVVERLARLALVAARRARRRRHGRPTRRRAARRRARRRGCGPSRRRRHAPGAGPAPPAAAWRSGRARPSRRCAGPAR